MHPSYRLLLIIVSLAWFTASIGCQAVAPKEQAELKMVDVTDPSQIAGKWEGLLRRVPPSRTDGVTLLDGGLSDNMALRGILEGAAVAGGLEQTIKNSGIKKVKKLVFISVNAETSPDVREYRSDHIPSTSRVFPCT